MLKSFNTTNIAIILKIKIPKKIVDFCLISLCNTIYKIITKAIFLRMQHLIPNIILQPQGCFVLGMEAIEGSLVGEVLHSINNSKSSHFFIKLDIIKAYDRVHWDILFKVLCKFGFGKNWCKWMRVYILGA